MDYQRYLAKIKMANFLCTKSSRSLWSFLEKRQAFRFAQTGLISLQIKVGLLLCDLIVILLNYLS